MSPGLGEAALDKKTFIHSSTCYIIHKCFLRDVNFAGPRVSTNLCRIEARAVLVNPASHVRVPPAVHVHSLVSLPLEHLFGVLNLHCLVNRPVIVKILKNICLPVGWEGLLQP